MSRSFWGSGAFDQASIDVMARAYDVVCGVKPTADSELVATHITNQAKLGLHATLPLGTISCSGGQMDRQHERTFDEVHGLMCLCGGCMVLACVEPMGEVYELYRFECKECHCATSVSFKSAAR